jgi:hypothetical protein
MVFELAHSVRACFAVIFLLFHRWSEGTAGFTQVAL